MKEGAGARVAAATTGAVCLAAWTLLLGACSGAPAPVTRSGGTAVAAATPASTAAPPGAGAAPTSATSTGSAGSTGSGGSPQVHSSEAEPKAAQMAQIQPPQLVSSSAVSSGSAGKASDPTPASAGPGTPPVGAPAVGSSDGAAGSSPVQPPASATAPAAAAAVAPAGASGPSGAAAARPPESTASNLVVPIDGSAARSDPAVVMIESADPDPESTLSLVDAARAEKERKAEAPPARIVINNKNLHTYAKGGQLTVADPKKGSGAAAAAVAPAGTAAAPDGQVAPIVRDEKYWRGRALEIRQRWRKAADQIKELEGDINLWRRRFYAEDDPYVRDGQIKPAWDRALDTLREDREAVAAAKKELDDFLEEGRRAGALPGWLREGIELEPKEEKPVDPLQPTATPIYKDHG
jgi:hypothetical protein